MSNYPKITEALYANKGVTGLPDTPGLSAGEMQQKFDELSKDVLIPFVNEHIDLMNSEDGASNLGAKPTQNMSGVESNVQAVLDALDDMVHNTYAGATFSVDPSNGHLIVTYVDGSTGDMGVVAFVPKGAYNPSVAYDKFSVVEYNASSYISINEVPAGVTPEDTDYWVIFFESASGTEITYEEYEALSDEQKANGDYYITDYPDEFASAENIPYGNTSVGSALDEIKSNTPRVVDTGWVNIAFNNEMQKSVGTLSALTNGAITTQSEVISIDWVTNGALIVYVSNNNSAYICTSNGASVTNSNYRYRLRISY